MSRAFLLSLARSLGVLAAFSLTLNAGPEAPAPSPVVSYSEISRKEVRLGDHKMTLIRVRPPVLAKTPPPPSSPAPAPTAKQSASAERLPEKACFSLSLTATVYLGGKTPVTELRWRDQTGKKEYKAWSNADFRYLSQLLYLETPTTFYQWFPFVEVYSTADLPPGSKSPLPKGLKLDPRGADYAVNLSARELTQEETTLAGLDYLHAYYQMNFAELKADYEKRERENAVRERELRLNPPKTPDATLRFWVPATK